MTDLIGTYIRVNDRGYRQWTGLQEVKRSNGVVELVGKVVSYSHDWGWLVDFSGMELPNLCRLHDGRRQGSPLKKNTGWWLDREDFDIIESGSIEELL